MTDMDRLERMRHNLKLLRTIAGYSAAEFGRILGCTRQTINNMEKKDGKMSITQYIAVDAIFGNLRLKDELLDCAMDILVDSVDNPEKEAFETAVYAAIGRFWINDETGNLLESFEYFGKKLQ